jgi:hypothetical protein
LLSTPVDSLVTPFEDDLVCSDGALLQWNGTQKKAG